MKTYTTIGVTCALLWVVCSAVAAESASGSAIFERWCVPCHGEQPAAPGTLRLGWNRGPQYALLTARNDLTAEYVTQIVRQGLHEMPPFRKTEIDDGELAALAAWLARPR